MGRGTGRPEAPRSYARPHMVTVALVAASVVDPAYASRVVGPAYDALRPHERRALADTNPDSFFNVVRSAADYPDGQPPAGLLDGNLAALQRLLASGRYRPYPPSLFVHRIVAANHTQTALVGDLLVSEHLSNAIRAHEHTLEAKEAELARHLDVLQMQSSPVGLAYRHEERLDRLVAATVAEAPILDFVTTDGSRQVVWALRPAMEAQVIDAAAAVRHVYIIDGHHRVAAASRQHPTGRFLAALVPDNQLRLLPYHRIVAGCSGIDLSVLLSDRFLIERLTAPAAPLTPAELTLALDGFWWRLTLREPTAGRLSAAIADEFVLEAAFGVVNPRQDVRLTYVPGNRTLRHVADLAAEQCGAAILVRAPTVAEVFAEADAGRALPPKSTWFEPKLRSGVFVVAR